MAYDFCSEILYARATGRFSFACCLPAVCLLLFCCFFPFSGCREKRQKKHCLLKQTVQKYR
ncbi:hypothetical protein [Allobaculum mucilyticum]|uniref:hypothetical protein n=1 Tax=Allobaculum mucilyticum TaxID=2834459 RepID=UPI001E533F54|nr:hypothetical protein [Allobaculum mucilyticum]UNT95362.1 hypothetical protein KWG62_08405 [Allobaculum mucilyticum]